MPDPRWIPRDAWLAGIKGTMTASGDAGVWRAASFAKLVPSEVKGVDIHWPGGNGNFASAQADAFRYFQQMQIRYRNGHQFDLGYSFGIPPNGWVFEIRGMQYRPASQNEPGNDIDENGEALSILLACDLDGRITDLQLTSARWVIAQVRATYAGGTWIKGHREHGGNATQCPGDVLVARIHAGDFEPRQEDDVPVTDAEMNAIADKTVAKLLAAMMPRVKVNPNDPDKISVQDALRYTARNTATCYDGTAPGPSTQVQMQAVLESTEEIKTSADAILAALQGADIPVAGSVKITPPPT